MKNAVLGLLLASIDPSRALRNSSGSMFRTRILDGYLRFLLRHLIGTMPSQACKTLHGLSFSYSLLLAFFFRTYLSC